MNFIIYDICFLVLFIVLVSIFLYRGKKNLKKEGFLLLYKTSWGIKLINYIGNKYKKTLKFLSYISIGLGYCLMAGMLYLFGRIIWIYIFNQDIVRAIKVPPIMPLIPYLPQVFKLDFPQEWYVPCTESFKGIGSIDQKLMDYVDDKMEPIMMTWLEEENECEK